MIMWLSDAFARQTGVSTDCIRLQARASVSHDNLFHSVLGLLSVSTPAYLVERDLFAKCRGEAERMTRRSQQTAVRERTR